MLRPLKTPNLGAHLIAFTGTTAGSAANTVSVGAQEGTFTNAVADSQLDLSFRRPFRRAPVVVASPGLDIADGGVAFVAAAPAITALSVKTLGSTGSGDVGTVHALALGWHDPSTVAHGGRYSAMYPVHGSFRRGRIIAGKVGDDGVQAIGGSQFSCVKNDTGDYTITFGRAFGRIPVVLGTIFNSTDGYSYRIGAATKTTVNILTFDDSSAAADSAFNFVAYGCDSTDEYYTDQGGQIEVGFRKPRLLPFKIISTAGTPSIAVGTDLGTVADTAEGVVTLTYAQEFAREPVVILCSADATPDWFASIDTSSKSSVKIEITDASADLGDPSDLFMLVFGSDDETEY